jgi:hypothetical protein
MEHLVRRLSFAQPKLHEAVRRDQLRKLRMDGGVHWIEKDCTVKVMKLTKIQVARRQLGTALALFLDDLDPVSVHTLACSGGEVAEHLMRKAGAEPFASHALATFADLNLKDIRLIKNQYWNSFKHATTHKGGERDDRKLLERFNDLQNDHTLFVGWHDYMLATNMLPIEAQLFQVWYFALYPDKLNPKVDVSTYKKTFPKLRSLSRMDQKKELRRLIARYRSNSDVTNDPQTERGQLIAA